MTASGPMDDPKMILQTLDLIVPEGEVIELRLLDVGAMKTAIGFYTDREKCVKAAIYYAPRAKGAYIVINQIDPVLLGRAANRIVERAESIGTKDPNITKRRWLPIDLDPVRPPDTLATNEEHAAAHERALAVRDWLTARGWPEPIYADSGNGAHLLYRVDLPGDTDLVLRCLEALSAKFTDARVNLDTSVATASRIFRLYGTVNRKADDIPGRPRRLARLIDVPQDLEPVAVDAHEEVIS